MLIVTLNFILLGGRHLNFSYKNESYLKYSVVMPVIDDADLIQLLGNPHTKEKGFTALVMRYQKMLYWHIRRLVVVHEDADDVLQNTFIKAWQAIEKFKGESKIYTWLYRIATNESITHLEKEKRKNPSKPGTIEISLSDKIMADTYFDAKKIEWKLQLAIQTLPEQQRAVFNLRYFDELPYREMSEVLQVSEGALKASFHHAAKKVEDYLLNH